MASLILKSQKVFGIVSQTIEEDLWIATLDDVSILDLSDVMTFMYADGSRSYGYVYEVNYDTNEVTVVSPGLIAPDGAMFNLTYLFDVENINSIEETIQDEVKTSLIGELISLPMVSRLRASYRMSVSVKVTGFYQTNCGRNLTQLISIFQRCSGKSLTVDVIDGLNNYTRLLNAHLETDQIEVVERSDAELLTTLSFVAESVENMQ